MTGTRTDCTWLAMGLLLLAATLATVAGGGPTGAWQRHQSTHRGGQRMMRHVAGDTRPVALLTARAPKCPVVDGAVDASKCAGGFDPVNSTLALRSALTSGASIVRIPAMGGRPWYIAPIPGVDPICPIDPKQWGHCPALHLFNLTNLTVIFDPGTVLLAIRNEFHNPAAAMIRVELCRNLRIVGDNATIRMWREDFADPVKYIHSESRGGVAVYDSSAVSIKGLSISHTGGDGIYLEDVNDTVVDGVNCHHNYRQGLSVASASALFVVDSHFTDTNGTAPMCGVDLEPDWGFYRLVNISFRRCEFSRNANCGFVINPYAITSGFSAWDPTHGFGANANQSISVTLDSCTFADNLRNETLAHLGGATVSYELSPGPLEGFVRISNSVIYGGAGPGVSLVDTSSAVHVELSNVSILDAASAGPLGPPFFNAPILVNAGAGTPTFGEQPPVQGNLTLDEVSVRYTANHTVNPSTPWPFFFAFASDELDSVQGKVAVETATPELVCAQQLIAPRATGVDIEVKCKHA